MSKADHGLADLTGSEAARLIAKRELTSEALVQSCLDRIAEREPDVRAWEFLDPDYAMEQARERDRALASGKPPGPLHGVPVGIKDIIDTADMPTQNGSAHFTGNRPEVDATCVALLRAAGAVITGKTVTTELANMTPGKTRNPHNNQHTPGGSSSGSAAAVACGMVPLALGTQTGGSVVRPASFCGIHGLKPTLGLIPRDGVLMQSHTLDTVGTYGRSVADIALLTGVLDAYSASDDVSYPRAKSDLIAALDKDLPARPSFGFFKTPAWPKADPDAQAAIQTLAQSLGDRCREINLSNAFDAIVDAHIAVHLVESDFYYGPLREKNAELLSPGIRERLAKGAATSGPDYLKAMALREPLYQELLRTLDSYDALICLSSPGPAPASRETTGNAIFNGMWTFLGVPTLSLPLLTVNGMPCGVTLVGKRRAEAKLLQCGKWLETALA